MTTIIFYGVKTDHIPRSNPYLQAVGHKRDNVDVFYVGIAVKTRNYSFDESDMATAKRRFHEVNQDQTLVPTFYVINL